MPKWQDLDDCLDGLAEQVRAQAYVIRDSGNAQLSPGEACAPALAERFDGAYEVVSARLGKGFLRKGKAGRVLHESEQNRFAAEVLLGTYLLVMLFEDAPDFFLFTRELDRAKPLLEALIQTRPPLGGGGRLAGKSRPGLA